VIAVLSLYHSARSPLALTLSRPPRPASGKKGTMDDTSEHMLSWFEDDELSICPSCGEKTVVPAPAGKDLAVCAACGIVAKPAAD
jgi:hypothetical protein